MSVRDLLLHHLDHTFARDAMQPSLLSAVRGLTAAQAAWKSSPARHSIWQIVRHVTHWKIGVLAALDRSPVDYDDHNKADWQEVAGPQEAWEADVQRLVSVSEELRARAEALDEEGLAEEIRWYRHSRRPRPILIRLHEVATHDTYHAGQIQYLVALQEIPVEELTAAASRNDLERVDRLIRRDPAVVGQLTRDGWTALHVAAYFGQAEAVRTLLQSGAPVNAVSRNEEANTPLHSALIGVGNRGELAALLLAHGADPTARDGRGGTPLDLAREAADTHLVALLEGGVPHPR